MKLKLSFLLLFIVSAMIGISQNIEKGMLYSSDFWLDYKGNDGDFVKANNNPKKEKVSILQSKEYFEVTLGNSIKKYKISSSSSFSKVRTDYQVGLDNIKYKVEVMDNSKSSFPSSSRFWIILKNIQDETIWSVTQINEVKEIEMK